MDIYAQLPSHWGALLTSTIHNQTAPAIDPTKVTLPTGTTVVVTGAGKGIGECIAKAYAKARASAVIITARTAENLEKVKRELEHIASGNGVDIKVSAIAGDASKEAHFQQIKQILQTEHGSRLDVLVNNAGAIGSTQGFTNKLHETSSEDMELITSLNYLGPYYAMKQLIPLMLNPQSVGKTITNVSSLAAFMTADNPIAYGISKVALNRLTQHVGESYADEGLVCLALHPGGVMSPGAQPLPESVKASEWRYCGTMWWLLTPNLVMKDDIDLCGAVCVWLSKERRMWASGRYISATWDMEELEAMKDEILKGDKLKLRMAV